MIEERIADPAGFLRDLGALHDVLIVRVSYDLQSNTIELVTPDLAWDRRGHPTHVSRPCTIVLRDVSAFTIVAGQDRFHTSLVREGAHVANATAIGKDGVTRLDLVFSTSEHWSIEFVEMAVLDEVTA